MASKERLYELWMLYYTKVSVCAGAGEDLPLTPVVAAARPPQLSRTVDVRARVCVWLCGLLETFGRGLDPMSALYSSLAVYWASGSRRRISRLIVRLSRFTQCEHSA